MNRNRKAQEEIAGFVLIVVIVAIILLIFLAIFIRKGNTREKNSEDIKQFLESMGEYTTDCNSYSSPNIIDLVKECYQSGDNECENGKNVCIEVNSSINEILKGSWDIGKNKLYAGYFMNISYYSNTTRESIIDIKAGNCSSGIYREGELYTYYGGSGQSGSIDYLLTICF